MQPNVQKLLYLFEETRILITIVYVMFSLLQCLVMVAVFSWQLLCCYASAARRNMHICLFQCPGGSETVQTTQATVQQLH